ncbi:MAG: hypothetical protein C0395_00215 [Gemmatimonas sp.]|nr:hypothetical protein [Gemmatimonas sp.]
MERLGEARLIAVGDELLNGRTLDANSHEIQQRLLRRGVTVGGVAVCRTTPPPSPRPWTPRPTPAWSC